MKRPLLESERILKSPTLSSFSPSEELADLARLANTLWSTVRWVFRVALGPEVQNDCIAFEPSYLKPLSRPAMDIFRAGTMNNILMEAERRQRLGRVAPQLVELGRCV